MYLSLTHRNNRTLLLILSSVMLSGCLNHDMSDLEQFIEDVKNRPASPIDPIPSIQQVDTYVYSSANKRSPFINEIAAEEYEDDTNPNGITINKLRTKEELEAYSLDTLKMVGTLKNQEGDWALIQNSDDVIFRVKPGNYMGLNHGQITRISEEQIDLTEIVPDRRGGFVERPATIALGE